MSLVTLTWSQQNNPSAGWDLFAKPVIANPDSLAYEGSISSTARSQPFHNVPATGLVQFGIAPVEYVNDNGVSRRSVGRVNTVTILDGVVVANSDPSFITNVNIDPNEN